MRDTPQSIARRTTTQSSLITSSILPPWRFGNPAGPWTFDFQSNRARREDSVPVSPKTTTAPHQQHPGYWLPAFLVEEAKDMSAEPAVDKFNEEDAGYDANDEATPTQMSFLHYQYHESGNYFIPVRPSVSADVARMERLWKNAWPPEVLTPVVGRFEEASGFEDVGWSAEGARSARSWKESSPGYDGDASTSRASYRS